MKPFVALLYANQTLSEVRAATGAPDPDDDFRALFDAERLVELGANDRGRDAFAKIASDESRPSRVRLWAGRALRDLGFYPGGPGARTPLGVVMDVPVDGGRDVLAVYRDGSARFAHHSGAISVYDGGNPRIDALVPEILRAADAVAQAPHGVPLPPGGPRVTLLTLSGERLADAASPLGPLLGSSASLVGRLAELRAPAR